MELNETGDRISVKTDKTIIDCDFVVMVIGARPSLDTVKELGAKIDKGIITDNRMRTSLQDFYSAGDICRTENGIFICSAIKATGQGKIAGANAAGNPEEQIYIQSPVVVQVKYKDFALYSAGSPMFCDSTEEIVENQAGHYRSLVKKDGTVFGVHMVGTDKDFNTYRKLLKY